MKFLDGEEYDAITLETRLSNDQTIIIKGVPNEKGFLGKLECSKFFAANIGEARLKALRAAAIGLSNIAVCLDVPAHILQTDVHETATGQYAMSMLAPYPVAPFCSQPGFEADPDCQKYASLYREGLNSNSPFYQFLCYYKIIEGLRERRALRRRKELAASADSRRSDQRMPRDFKLPNQRTEQLEWIKSLFDLSRNLDEMALDMIFLPEAIGRTVGNLVAKSGELHKIRLRIAHAILDSGEPTYSIEDGLNLDEVNKWLPLTKCLARHLLKEAFPTAFPSAQTIR